MSLAICNEIKDIVRREDFIFKLLIIFCNFGSSMHFRRQGIHNYMTYFVSRKLWGFLSIWFIICQKKDLCNYRYSLEFQWDTRRQNHHFTQNFLWTLYSMSDYWLVHMYWDIMVSIHSLLILIRWYWKWSKR